MRWARADLSRWDAEYLPASAMVWAVERYERSERALREALTERVEPAPVAAPPPPPVEEPVVEAQPVEEVEEDDVPGTDDALVEEASTWHRIWKPFLSESVGWFVGGFLILAGTLYWSRTRGPR